MEVLYVYDHCPFCVKARMIFGLKKRPYVIHYLLNDDEATPIKMIGEKMLPILDEDGHYMGESMDIVHKINNIDGNPVLTGETSPAVAAWIKQVNSYINKLLIPRYVNATLPEFTTEEARTYFTNKKEAAFGDFKTLLSETDHWLAKINKDLLALEPLIKSPKACNGELSEDDIQLFPLLRGLSIVEGVNYPSKVDQYRKNMSDESGVPLYNMS
ncbi:glutaredoxin 2 [Entomomonas sp. E2T0]|uniref:glutaredoxin 2 n=1 Tax=Entomomonas sp. E2T0 TaxID=2930213 RepID=UPI0022281D04|nr:glutaredoxin 2 [Entomomonas sp. E2T0]UYZ83234.1 glutaredoxin 2 [Entomomonas sp. E2T0]